MWLFTYQPPACIFAPQANIRLSQESKDKFNLQRSPLDVLHPTTEASPTKAFILYKPEYLHPHLTWTGGREVRNTDVLRNHKHTANQGLSIISLHLMALLLFLILSQWSHFLAGKGALSWRLNPNFPPKLGSLEKATGRNCGEKRTQPGREPHKDDPRLIPGARIRHPETFFASQPSFPKF